jgi:hypothetical protein
MPSANNFTTDHDIRNALHAKRLGHLKSSGDVLVVDELGLAHAKSRIDVAVINGCVHGYEIKSAQDTLARLPSQLGTYRETLERLTVVCASKHVKGVIRLTPEWCGIIEARQGARGAIHFHSVRRTLKNPELQPCMLAHLLWHSEAVSLLSHFKLPPRELRRPRKHLYTMIAELMTPKEITASIRHFMGLRPTWRGQQEFA